MQTLFQSPTDPDFVQDPYRFYDTARGVGPLFYWDEYQMVCATSHEAVTALLKDRRLGRECPPEKSPSIPERLAPFYEIEAHSMLELEAPRHTRLRRLILHAFTSRRVEALAPEIADLCRSLIKQFPAGPFDLLETYAKVLPVIVICRLLGVPETKADQLLQWSNAMVAMYQAKKDRLVEDAAVKASREFAEFVRSTIAKKRRNPGNDLLTELIKAESEGDRLSEEELVTTVILLLNAGHEATVHTLGNGVATLISAGVSTITPATVEEVLRFDPPLHMFTRWVYEDVELFGHRFQRGDQVACLLAAANRDPRAYPEPDRFDPLRKGPVNTSFGAGIHFCVGAPLARLELQISLRLLFEECPTLKIVDTPRYADVYHFHGLKDLMVEL